MTNDSEKDYLERLATIQDSANMQSLLNSTNEKKFYGEKLDFLTSAIDKLAIATESASNASDRAAISANRLTAVIAGATVVGVIVGMISLF